MLTTMVIIPDHTHTTPRHTTGHLRHNTTRTNHDYLSVYLSVCLFNIKFLPSKFSISFSPHTHTHTHTHPLTHYLILFGDGEDGGWIRGSHLRFVSSCWEGRRLRKEFVISWGGLLWFIEHFGGVLFYLLDIMGIGGQNFLGMRFVVSFVSSGRRTRGESGWFERVGLWISSSYLIRDIFSG